MHIPSRERITAVLQYLDTPSSRGYPMHTLEALDQLHTICNDTLGYHPTRRQNENIPYIVNNTLRVLNSTCFSPLGVFSLTALGAV